MNRSLTSRMRPALSGWPVIIVFLAGVLGGASQRAFGAGKVVAHPATLRAARNAVGPLIAGIKVKANLAAPAAATPTLLAFVTNENSNSVSVIDISTNTVVNVIPVGIQPVAAALTPDRSRLYVANFGDATVSVVDTATNTVTTAIPVGIQPVGVAITPDGSKAYVANFASSGVSVIDIATNAVIDTILTGPPAPALVSAPSSVVVSPDGTRVYIANFNLNTVTVIDSATDAILTTIAVGAEPIALAVTQDGGSVYVANFGASSVTVIATATNSVSGSVSVGRDPSGVVVTPDGASVYVTNKAENSVSVITAATNVAVATIPVDTNPVGIAVAPDGATIYASNFGSSTVSVIAVATNTVTGTIAVGDGPFGIAIPRALPPSIATSFGAARIALNGTTSLSFTITNPNITARLAGIAFTDNLPAGLAVALPGDLTSACGGSAVATDGASSVSLSGVVLTAGASCTVSVNVTGSTSGLKSNSVTVTSLEGGAGNTASANLTVVAPPAMVEAFGAASIPLGGTTSLSFTVTNPNSADTLTGISFSDTLPTGLVISTPGGLTGACGGGTITAAQGTNLISLAGASLPAGGSCSFSLNVTGIAAGTQNNTTSSVASTEGGTGSAAFASIVVVAPPSLAKAFNPATISLNGTSSLTFTITNPAANVVSLTGVAFTDTLPAGLTVADGSSTVCGGTLTATAPTGIALSGATVTVNSQCQFSVTVTGAASGSHTNTTSNVTSANGGTGNAATASLTVASAPTVTKAFGAVSVPLNGTTSLTLTISNPNAGVVLTGLAFTDSLPAGLVVAATPNLANTCGGTAGAAAGSGSVSLSAGTLATGASCTVSVDVTGTTVGVKNNSVSVTSVEGGAGNTANASLVVAAPPSILKAFGVAGIPLNGSTSLTFSISNPNAGLALTGLAFTDSLPAGLVVAATPGLTNTCGGTATAVGGSSSISLIGGSAAAGGSCTLSVNVTGTTVGVKSNSVSVTSTEGGAGNTANATITVNGPPTISKAFGAASIPLNGSTSLSFTITNPNATSTLSGIGFADPLPVGLVIATPNGLSGSCGGGTITATAATNVISLTGASRAAGGTCSFSVNVKGTVAGTQNNTTGNVTSTEGGTGSTASASIVVVAPPSLAKAFSPTGIPLNGTSSLTFTITNPAANTVALTGVAFTDTLPPGLTVANTSATICGGTLTTTAPTGIALSGATIAANSQCQFSVTVTGAVAGSYANTTDNVTSTNGGTGNAASSNLTVAAAPVIVEAFGAAGIPLNGNTSLTFTISNPNAGLALTGVAFTDSLPSGLVVASTPGLISTCGGTATAVGGSSSVSLSGGTVAAGGLCTLSVNVTGASVGVKSNSVSVTSTESGAGNTSNASITVNGPPAISKAFGAASIPLNGSTSLSFTVNNPNSTSTLSGIGFIDPLPAGLVIATPSGLSGSCGAGTITATAATNGISLTAGSLAAGGTCSFSVNVMGTAAGTKNNTTGNVTSTEGGTGGSASASIVVVAPPSLAKVFSPAGIPLNGTSSLTFTITNPAANALALAGVAFTDTLPAGLTVANTSATICGGTLTTTAPTGIALSGATIAVNGQCQFSVTVTGVVSGNYINTTDNVTSTNGGTGNAATAGLAVAIAPTITKIFGATAVPLNGTTSLTFTISNPNSGMALTGLAFTDSLPSGLVVATTPGLLNTCGGTATAVGGSSSISLSGGTAAAGGSCTLSVNVTGASIGVKSNSVSVTSTEGGAGNTANATITVNGPPAISKAFGAASIPLNGSTSLSFTVNNPNAASILSGIGFSDTLPAGLVISTPNGLSGSCGGTITAAAATNVISLSGASLAAGGTCNFSVNVKGTAAGIKNNTTGNVTSTEGGTGSTASASIIVVAPPSLGKAFSPTGIPLNATSSLTFTITNPAANTVALAGVAFIETLPVGLTVANTSATVCGGTLTATAPTGIALSGAAIAVNSQCQFSVTVTGAVLGNYTSTTGNVTSTNGGTGNTASSNLTVENVPSMIAAFGAASIPLNGTTTLTFSITNPNSGSALTGVAFTDSLPAGLTVAPTPNLSNTCGGTFTAAAGAGQIFLNGAILQASASCAASVDVQGTTTGVKNNSVTVTSTEGGAGLPSNASVTVVSGLRFVPVAPCRIADTRNATGPFGGPFLHAQTTRGFTIPQSGCGIPAAAQAYSLNVTVVPHGTLGFLTMFPCGQAVPLVSTLNSIDGRVKAAAAIVPAGTNGAVCAFVTHDTDMILDINGYFVPATDATALDFYPLAPCRLVDTRPPSGPLGGPSLTGKATRTFPVLSSSCNIPSEAKAYSLNFTSIPKGTLGFLTTWPAGQTQPLVSTLNAPTGAVTANAAIVPAGNNGDISVFVTDDSDLVIDINGYFAAPAPGGLSLFNVAPCRVVDTRSPTPTNGQPFTSLDLNITTAGCGVPAAAQSYVLNATVVPSGTLGFLTLWPQGAPKPLVSTLNAVDGAVTSNMAIVPTANGSISAFASNPTHMVLDISGYFAPSQPGGFAPATLPAQIAAGMATVQSDMTSGPEALPSGASARNEIVFSISLHGVDAPRSPVCCTILEQKATERSGSDDECLNRRNSEGVDEGTQSASDLCQKKKEVEDAQIRQ